MLLLLAFLSGIASENTLTCHCYNDATCDSNGFCAQGCKNGWYGPGCQVGNVALGKQANQSTTYTDYGNVGSADRAVDGMTPTNDGITVCTHTVPDNEGGYPVAAQKGSAWWFVTLDTTNPYFIINVTLVNRRGYNSNRLTHFVILYTNDTEGVPNPNSSNWHECARENGTVGLEQTYICNESAIAKRVAVYLTASYPNNTNSILTLCEVQIYGYMLYDCQNGFTGPGCLLRACDHCNATGGVCTGDFESCKYDACPDQSLLPPDCWITLSNFSGLNIHSTTTCNSLLLSPVLPESKPNIAATSLQLQVTKPNDQEVLVNATFSVPISNTASYKFSNATADTSYKVSVNLMYCNNSGNICFHTTESKAFSVHTGKREYAFSHNNSCFFINVTSITRDCELPSAIQVTCEAQVSGRNNVSSSSLTTCGLERDLGYSCSVAAFININAIEKRSANISAEPRLALPVAEKNVAVLAGSIGGSIAFIVLIVVIVVIVYCRRQRKSKPKPDTLAIASDANENFRETAGTRNATTVLSRSNAGLLVEDEEQTYYNTYGMNLSKFQLYVQNEALIARRFSELQANEAHTCNHGRSPNNKEKNRFRNILPYDVNRVQLASSANDYINASYINGFSKPKEYIAAQGPSSKTVDDFWQMLWQEKCSVIIMLTDYVENAKRKCEKYFPYARSQESDIEVTVCSSTMIDTHTVTVLEVRQGSEVRQVYHFHFLAWPDQSVPSHTAEVLLFYSRLCLHLKRKPSKGPLLVHCSAGVGRTGAYIAFDYLLQRFQSESTVDVDSCVVKLRDQRVLMVQTKEQYIFLHRVLLYGLKTSRYIYDTSQLPSPARKGQLPGSSTKITKSTEWQELQAAAPTLHELSFAASVLPENRSKNRRSKILAVEYKRPLLSRPDDGSQLYINAVYCNGCYSNRAFIATQVPLRQTVDDFWLMVYECKPSCIILLHDLPTTDEEDCQCYWPEPGHSLTTGWFTVKSDLGCKEDSSRNARMSGFEISLSPVSSHMTSGEIVSTKFFTTNLWDTKQSKELPADANAVLGVANALRAYCVLVPRQPIIVQCRDGVTQSGLFLSAVNALHRLIETEQVSVFHTVDLLRTSRPEFITSEGQYRFIYQILELHRESSSIYANS